MESTTQAQRFIDALHSLENAGSADAAPLSDLVGLFADNATIHNAALRLTHEEESGIDSVRRFWTEYKKTIGASRSLFSQVTTSANAAGLFWTTEGAVTYSGATLLVFDESGKIIRLEGYYDTAELNRATGATKA